MVDVPPLADELRCWPARAMVRNSRKGDLRAIPVVLSSTACSLIRGGLGISSGADLAVIGLVLFRMFGQPLLSVAALAAAWRNCYLAAATVAVAVMTLVDVGGFAIFAMAVFLYGF